MLQGFVCKKAPINKIGKVLKPFTIPKAVVLLNHKIEFILTNFYKIFYRTAVGYDSIHTICIQVCKIV